MELIILPKASASGLSTVSTPARSLQPSTASENPLITAVAMIHLELESTLDASIGVNTACLLYNHDACQAGAPGPGTRCCTDSSSPVCQTLFWPTSHSLPDEIMLKMVDLCAPTSDASGILGTTQPLQTSTPPPPSQNSGFLKAPAGTILEVFLGATLIFVLVAISCVIVTRKVHAARSRELRANESRSSVTVSASPGRPTRDHGIPLSTSPEIRRGTGGIKMDQPGRHGIERGSDAAMV